jgi:hypothetical protein
MIREPSRRTDADDPDRVFRVASALIGIRSHLFPSGSARSTLYALLLRPLVLWIARRSPGIELSPALNDQSVTLRRQGSAHAACPTSLLILKADHVGDLITSLPACKLLRDAFPSCHITLVCGSWNKAFAESTGLFDRVVTLNIFPERSGNSSFRMAVDPREALRNLPTFDVAIDLKVESDSRPILPAPPSPSRCRCRGRAPGAISRDSRTTASSSTCWPAPWWRSSTSPTG